MTRGKADLKAYARAIAAARPPERLEILDPAGRGALDAAYSHLVAFCMGLGAAFFVAWSMS